MLEVYLRQFKYHHKVEEVFWKDTNVNVSEFGLWNKKF